ncbi:MAG TPA: hypothetical protein PLF40_26415, partial [Kofleriaceae bacterium]|nr:hypothetical protein [Kofleriaceae bacterium]
TDTGTDTDTDTDTSKDPHTTIALRMDAGLGAAFRMAPQVMPTITIGVAAKLKRFTLRMSGTGGWRSTPVDATGYPNASASYRWLTARAQGCIDIVHQAPFELAGCIGFEVGSLNVAAHNIVNATASSRLWLAPQLGLRSHVRLGQSRWHALAQFGIAAPIIRDRYQFQPATTIAQTAAITVAVDFGAAVHF